MTWEYVERKILEALKISGGNVPQARKHIMAWTYEDNKLLYELAKPHMTGIVSHAIGHVIKKQEDEAAQSNQPKIKPVPEQTREEEFGMEILKAIATGGSPRFGLESNAPRLGKKEASQKHIDAITKMAKKQDDS